MEITNNKNFLKNWFENNKMLKQLLKIKKEFRDLFYIICFSIFSKRGKC